MEMRSLVAYILATKFYNEQDNLPGFIKNIGRQTVRPEALLLLDDGSVDRSAGVALEEAMKEDFEYHLVQMPKKAKGNLDTLGRAWSRAQPLLKQLAIEVDYVAFADIDTRFPQDYFQRVIGFLEEHPRIGVAAGQVRNHPRRSFPMFTGKVVRSDVVTSIDHYWDISIDSFLNVKALKLQYDVVVLDNIEVESRPTHLLSAKGRFRSGRLAYYAGIGPLYAVLKAIAKRDSLYLRGYWSEYFRGKWRSQDQDVLEYYQTELKRKVRMYLERLLGLDA